MMQLFQKINNNICKVNFLQKIHHRILFFTVVLLTLFITDLLVKTTVEKKLGQKVEKKVMSAPNTYLAWFLDKKQKKKELWQIKEVVVIPHFWHNTYVRNYDIGFSFLSFLDNFMSRISKMRFLSALQILASLAALLYLIYTKFVYLLPFTLVIAGGFGNAIDRISRGYVVDYVKWFIPGSPIKLFDPWPIFNLSDSYVVIGVFLLLISFMADSPAEKSNNK